MDKSATRDRSLKTWHMIVMGLTFFAVSVVIRRALDFADDDPESWARTLVPTAISAVFFTVGMGWWLQRKSRHT